MRTTANQRLMIYVDDEPRRFFLGLRVRHAIGYRAAWRVERREAIVNNESSEIIRMLNSAFDAWGRPEPAHWLGEQAWIDIPDACIELAGRPRDQADAVVRRLLSLPDADAALGVLDLRAGRARGGSFWLALGVTGIILAHNAVWLLVGPLLFCWGAAVLAAGTETATGDEEWVDLHGGLVLPGVIDLGVRVTHPHREPLASATARRLSLRSPMADFHSRGATVATCRPQPTATPPQIPYDTPSLKADPALPGTP